MVGAGASTGNERMTQPKPGETAARVPPADPNQAEFDWVFPHMRQVVTVGEASRALAVGEQQVRDLVDEGRIEAFAVNDAEEKAQQRRHLRIWRPSVVRFIRERLSEVK